MYFDRNIDLSEKKGWQKKKVRAIIRHTANMDESDFSVAMNRENLNLHVHHNAFHQTNKIF